MSCIVFNKVLLKCVGIIMFGVDYMFTNETWINDWSWLLPIWSYASNPTLHKSSKFSKSALSLLFSTFEALHIDLQLNFKHFWHLLPYITTTCHVIYKQLAKSLNIGWNFNQLHGLNIYSWWNMKIYVQI